MFNNLYLYDKAILDCEQRIGSYIASGGSSEDDYVKHQIALINKYTNEALSNGLNDTEEEE